MKNLSILLMTLTFILNSCSSSEKNEDEKNKPDSKADSTTTVIVEVEADDDDSDDVAIADDSGGDADDATRVIVVPKPQSEDIYEDERRMIDQLNILNDQLLNATQAEGIKEKISEWKSELLALRQDIETKSQSLHKMDKRMLEATYQFVVELPKKLDIAIEKRDGELYNKTKEEIRKTSKKLEKHFEKVKKIEKEKNELGNKITIINRRMKKTIGGKGLVWGIGQKEKKNDSVKVNVKNVVGMDITYVFRGEQEYWQGDITNKFIEELASEKKQAKYIRALFSEDVQHQLMGEKNKIDVKTEESKIEEVDKKKKIDARVIARELNDIIKKNSQKLYRPEFLNLITLSPMTLKLLNENKKSILLSHLLLADAFPEVIQHPLIKIKIKIIIYEKNSMLDEGKQIVLDNENVESIKGESYQEIVAFRLFSVSIKSNKRAPENIYECYIKNNDISIDISEIQSNEEFEISICTNKEAKFIYDLTIIADGNKQTPKPIYNAVNKLQNRYIIHKAKKN